MVPHNLSKGLTRLQQFGSSIGASRRLSEQQLVTVKKTGAHLKTEKKPCRPPFMKNVFLGEFDKEMLVYPELDKTSLQQLKQKIEPHRKYFNDNVDPEVISSSHSIPNELIEHFKILGLFGQTIPAAYEGYDQTSTETALISEIVAKDLNVALTLYSHNFLGAQSLVMFGSPEQKAKYLPKLASGEWISALCLSESSSSSDLASIKTKIDQVEGNPDQYVLNGKKQWVINGANANLFIVLVQNIIKMHTGEPLPAPRLLLVERDAPGVTVSSPTKHMGLNASQLCDVQFSNTRVHSNCFIGTEVQGFEICSKVLNSGRYNIGAITISLLKNLMHKASNFIISRKQIEKNLYEQESIQQKFAKIATSIYALESMTYHTAALLDNYDNPDCSLELAIIKVFSFTEGRKCLDLIMELMGGRAFMNSEITQKYFRDFRTMEVFDGTTNIAKLFISLHGLQHAGTILNDNVAKARSPFNYPGFIVNKLIKFRRQANDDPKLTLQLYEQLHPSLKFSANELEYCVLRMYYAVDIFLSRHGPDATNQQLDLMRFADAAVRIYAMTTVLGRASRSYCIGLRNAESEIKYALSICSSYKQIVQKQLNFIIDGVVRSGDWLTIQQGPDILEHHGYFLESPLERTY